MSEESDEDLAFCTKVALLVGDGRNIIERDDGVSFYIKVNRGVLERYKRLNDDYFIIEANQMPETDDEIRAFWKKHFGSSLSVAEAELVSSDDLQRARMEINMLFARAISDDKALH